ncbi:CHAP domain-containing protein [Nonomuraea cavernae]|uniref:Peptidase C51 domain-containing protein n=1 Tax=Nonomuraea cavernae TaxID=2045107 RepID=A0A917Z9V3_9ACTN|nr:CHAP domain-containing protein [Nonomuraea cavernae]MCA2189389.1 CHAP domain-containing protein [Nonomuraea cavernae]GGO76927.1 hypothetical protein GCM10012289_55380 [Nonomuraea cavernae]
MTPETKKFIDLLESQLGYSEKSGAYTKFGDWYGKNVEFDADYSSAPWCDMLLSWAAHKLGYEEWMGQFAWTVGHARWFKKNDAWGRKPEPGAFVFFDWGGSNSIGAIDHVGVVTKVEGNTIHTIEGNIDGGVLKRKERDTSKVVGYGYPARIKERLDQRLVEQQARENASRDRANQPTTENSPDLSRLQNGPLSSLIPYSEVQQEPQAGLNAQTKPSQKRRDEVPQAGASAPAAPQAQAAKPQSSDTSRTSAAKPSTGTGTGQTVKKGKHAKPATADTKAVTSEPLPVLVDASASHPAPALGSPALIGSALVAALAVLAVAKTKQLRVRPLLAVPSPVAPARRGHHRRKPRTAIRATAILAAPAPAAVEPATPLIAEPVIPAPLVPVGVALPFAPVVVPDIPEAVSAFDAFTPFAAPQRATRELRPVAAVPSPAPIRRPFESPIRTRRPFAVLDDAWQELDSLSRPSHAHRRDSGYYGRRRRSGHPVEEPAAFTPDAPLRGRRHRTSDTHRADIHRIEPHRIEPHRTDMHRSEPHRADQRWSDPRFSDPRRADLSPWPSPRRLDSHRTDSHRAEPYRADPHRTEPYRSDPHRADPLRTDQPRTDAYWADALWPIPSGVDGGRGSDPWVIERPQAVSRGRRDRVADAYVDTHVGADTYAGAEYAYAGADACSDEPLTRAATPRGRRHRVTSHAIATPALVAATGPGKDKASRRGRHRA